MELMHQDVFEMFRLNHADILRYMRKKFRKLCAMYFFVKGAVTTTKTLSFFFN